MKRLFPVSIALTVATITASVAALTLDKSLPYRIGFADYGRYTWTHYLATLSVGLAVLAFLCGVAAHNGRLAPALAVFGLTPLLLLGGVHSGPNPQAWCYNNLRHIEAAKDQLALQRSLTNGSPALATDIFRLMPGGLEPRCAKRGAYIMNPIGNPARCTVHGTIPEMEATWQKAM